MTDQNNLARGYSSDVSEEDPLAELARIVSGQEPVVRKPAVSPFQQPASQPSMRSAAEAAAAAPVIAAPAAKAPIAPIQVEAPAFDLEDALMAELGFGEEPVSAAPEPVEHPPVVQAAEPQAVMVEQAPAMVSLEDQLLAELSFDDALPEPARADISFEAVDAEIVPHADEPIEEALYEPAEEPVEEHAAELEAETSYDQAVQAVELVEPEHVAQAAEPAQSEEPGETEAEYDELAAILQELSEPKSAGEERPEEFHQEYGEHYFDEPEQPVEAADALDNIDFGSAFEAELRQMEVAAPVAAEASAGAIRKPHISLATPVVPRREVTTERELEDHFAAAFAQELDMGVSRAMEQGSRSAPAHKQAAVAPVQQQVARQADDLDPEAFDDPAAHWDEENWPAKNWDDQYTQDPGHDSDDVDLGIAAIVPPAGGRSRGFKLAVGALGVAALVCVGAIAMALTGGGDKIASGEPVIVKADTSPVKVKPENPGGLEIANQDQVVYNKVSGGDETAGSQEKLVSAAEEPISIANVTEEDPAAAASGDEQLAPASADVAVPAADALPADAKADARLAPVAEEASNTVPALAPRRVKTMLIKPDGTVVPAEEVAAAEPLPATTSLAPETQSNAALEPIEAAAPAETAPAAAAPAEAAAASVQDGTQVSSTLPADATAITGQWAVQLASQRSAEDAQATFQNLKSKFPDVLGSKPLAVQRAEVEGKGVFYRVRVPAQTKEEAVALCEQLKAAGGSCFIAR